MVGVPGDRIGYYDKVLYVNDEPMDQNPLGRYVGSGSGTVMSGASLRVERLEELLIGKAFRIWMNWDFGHGIDWKRIGKSID